eukprot:CAMPEP_0206022046 /NCGR_PEP_ID=MMETSP1464-20131121/33987_1 /ASSEMBLY_ACC=CAM_ASM_001124 /TAXON_ID=119497 /ORGANISM="Exanthemachrysis gayraliae, Strain RCC1523" /LENGTH=224 /DNA_ID=CAMNT_0053396003 /DNA_START=96 /DNA_END=767 /DNA_ORIENTATION=+
MAARPAPPLEEVPLRRLLPLEARPRPWVEGLGLGAQPEARGEAHAHVALGLHLDGLHEGPREGQGPPSGLGPDGPERPARGRDGFPVDAEALAARRQPAEHHRAVEDVVPFRRAGKVRRIGCTWGPAALGLCVVVEHVQALVGVEGVDHREHRRAAVLEERKDMVSGQAAVLVEGDHVLRRALGIRMRRGPRPASEEPGEGGHVDEGRLLRHGQGLPCAVARIG